ncbi:MAG: nucleotidyl transferase AbiEii/AbiGii toxin family protein [Candidatus Helarchaeota archaeon]|nr:nucleotidyl transferase AbiEii/AbiGii toxin family protein [Candidatus Helarchaeota archaeon]
MKGNLLDLSGKIDRVRLLAFEKVSKVANSLGVPFFIIGAAARDLILMNSHNIPTIRATLDIDFGVQVPSWDQYLKLKQGLMETGEFAETEDVQRMMFQSSLRIDLIPFGPIADNTSTIKWPPDQEIVMSILGFEESFRHSQTVRLSSNPKLDIKIVTLSGLAAMKIISWKDRYPERDRDAIDLALIIRNYTDAGNFERIFNEALDLVDSEGFDYVSVGARLLGRDIAVVLSTDTEAVVLEILNNETGKQDRYRLIEDMMRSDVLLTNDFEDVLRWLEEVKTGILEGI